MRICIVLDIGDTIIVIIGIIVIALFMGIFMQIVSSIFNVRIKSKFGRTIVRPDDWGYTKEMIKETGSIIKESTVNLYDKIKKINPAIITILKSKKMDKLDKLNYLSGLKDKGIINIEEFETLKKDIINGLI